MAEGKQAKKPFERLPTDVLPRNYILELRPDLKNFTFEGKLEIITEVRAFIIFQRSSTHTFM